MSSDEYSSSGDEKDDNADDELLLAISELHQTTMQYLYSSFAKNKSNNQSPQEKYNNQSQKQTRKRKKKGAVFYVDDDGEQKVLPAAASHWYRIYVSNPDLNNKRFHKKFRLRFRMPYKQYLEILEDCKKSDIFHRWKNKDATGKDPVPLELLILTALRYLGRGWTFDDLSESTGISEEVIRVFFQKFTDYGSTVLFNRYVIAPQTPDEAKKHGYEFEMAGLAGAIGSMDATHVVLERVSLNRRQSHLGFKLSSTARTYNLVVNHRRRILGTTDGHPARWNDKTIVRFDKITMGLKNGTLLNDYIFELYDYNSKGEIIKVRYRGPWIIVDNGYHSWSVTIPPFKSTNSRKEVMFSEWLESMRKDVECTFGILKGRWRILKAGIRVHGLDQADKIWKTCCALHNYLLDIDGLDEKWDGSLGEHDDRDIATVPALKRLNDRVAARAYDSSGMGRGNDLIDDGDFDDEDDDDRNINQKDEVICVRNLSFNNFRSKLVTHFSISIQKGEVKWPERK